MRKLREVLRLSYSAGLSRQELQKRRKDSAVQAYFKIYDYESVKNKITNFLSHISDLLELDSEKLAHELDYLTEEVSQELQSSNSLSRRK